MTPRSWQKPNFRAFSFLLILLCPLLITLSGLALLEGEKLAIKPQGFDSTHKRNAQTHRLNQDTGKWEPYHADGGNGQKKAVAKVKE